jgi:hypothetical protein
LIFKYYFTFSFMSSLFSYFYEIFGTIAHNVPTVYDGLTARIRALRSKAQGWQTVGGVSRANERSD